MSLIPLSQLNKPIFIAGPCSAESPQQLHNVASELVKSKSVTLFRAGVWKPRTRPNSFEGVGFEGLKWLAEIQKQFSLPVITEVANANHAEACLKEGIKHLWIGARTTVNPFSVQEIVDVLKGENVAVLVKNPIHADINLWQGSIERFLAAGINNIGAIHRGFSSFMKSEYRNLPMWNIPIELKRRMPELPIICDPSHIGGSTQLVPKIAQKAFDINMAGLMVEVHPDPKHAKSDAEQQLTPSEFLKMVDGLKLKNAGPVEPTLLNKLEELRTQIDKIDEDLISTLTSRNALIEEIGKHKLENNIAVLQLERWNEILSSRSELADKLGLDHGFVAKLMEIIHQESIRIQSNLNTTKD